MDLNRPSVEGTSAAAVVDEQRKEVVGSVGNGIFDVVSPAEVLSLFSSPPPLIVAAPASPSPVYESSMSANIVVKSGLNVKRISKTRAPPKPSVKQSSAPLKSQPKEEDNDSAPKRGHVCSAPGCEQPASMTCPTCVQLDLPKTRFCTQECFKSCWSDHKTVHKKAQQKAHDQALFLSFLPDLTGMTDMKAVAEIIKETWTEMVAYALFAEPGFDASEIDGLGAQMRCETLFISIERHGTCRNRITRCDVCRSSHAGKLVVWLTSDGSNLTVVGKPTFG